MSKEAKTKKSVKEAEIPDSIRAGVEAIAKGMGVAAIELWAIFVRQYVVRGFTELFTALVLMGVGVHIAFAFGYWCLVPFALALPFCYAAIMSLGNPKYYAIQDITRKIKELK